MKRRHLAAGIALLALLGAGAYFLFGSRAEGPQRDTLAREGAARVEAPADHAAVVRSEETRTQPTAEPAPAAATSGALRVLALDAEGRPLPKAQIWVLARASWVRATIDGKWLWRGEADEQGRAEWKDAAEKLAALEPGDALAVLLGGCVPFADFASVERGEQLAKELELRAPPFGSVVVRVWTPLEKPLWFGHAKLIAWSGKGTESGRASTRDPYQGAVIENGVARFHCVGLNTPLRAVASVESGPEVAADVPPLSESGEQREIDLRLGSDSVVLRLRVLAEDSRLLPSSRNFDVNMAHDKGPFSWRGGYTDPDSVLWMTVGAGWQSENGDVRISIDGREEGTVEVGAAITRERGLIDLGDAVLRKGVLLVAGRVLMPDGSPAKVADVQASLTPWDPILGDPPHSNGLRIDDEGRFAWHHAAGETLRDVQVQLFARLNWGREGTLLARPLVVPIGTKDAELRLEELGSIRGTFRERLPLEPKGLQASVRAVDRPFHPAEHYGGSMTAEGVSFANKLAGRYTLRILQDVQPLVELLAIEDLVVEAGKPCADPRLASIDLASRCTVLEFELEGPSQLGVLEGWVHLRRSGAAEANWNRCRVYGPTATALLPLGRYDAVFEVQGTREQLFADLSAGRRVVLRAGIAVKLEIEGPFERPDPAGFLRVKLRRKESAIGEVIASTPFDATGVARIVVPAPGRYQVEWTQHAPQGSSMRERTLEADSPEVVVAESDAEQRVALSDPRRAKGDGKAVRR